MITKSPNIHKNTILRPFLIQVPIFINHSMKLIFIVSQASTIDTIFELLNLLKYITKNLYCMILYLKKQMIFEIYFKFLL